MNVIDKIKTVIELATERDRLQSLIDQTEQEIGALKGDIGRELGEGDHLSPDGWLIWVKAGKYSFSEPIVEIFYPKQIPAPSRGKPH